MADEHIQGPMDVRGLLWQHVPNDMPPALVDALGDYLWGRSCSGVLMLQEDWHYLARGIGFSLESVGGRPDPRPADEPDLATLEEIESRDREMFLALLRKLTPAVEPPPNVFMVGLHADYVWVAKPFKSKLSKADALSLAVYLAYLADPDMSTFLPLLQAVVES